MAFLHQDLREDTFLTDFIPVRPSTNHKQPVYFLSHSSEMPASRVAAAPHAASLRVVLCGRPLPPQPRWPQRGFCQRWFLSLEQTGSRALLFLAEHLASLHGQCRSVPCIPRDSLQAPSALNLPLSSCRGALPLLGWIFMVGAQYSSISYRDELRPIPIPGKWLDSCGKGHIS